MITHAPSFHQEETGLSRVEYAYRKIKNSITHNVYPANFQILEPELAKKLGISRTPVREALIRLEADKLIQLIPRRGMRVNPLSISDLREVLDIQFALVKLVIENLSPADTAALNECCSSIRPLSDPLEWFNAESAFFVDLASFSKNVRLKVAIECLCDQIHRAKIIAFNNELSCAPLVKQLTDIAGSIEARRFTDAYALYRRYQESLMRGFLLAQETRAIGEF